MQIIGIFEELATKAKAANSKRRLPRAVHDLRSVIVVEFIDSFLAQQPWWAIVLGTVVLLSFLQKGGLLGFSIQKAEPRDFRAVVEANARPVSFSAKSSQSISLSTATSKSPRPSTEIVTNEMIFEGAEANELQRLLSCGDKIGAITLVREKHDLQLIDAKRIVEAMEKAFIDAR